MVAKFGVEHHHAKLTPELVTQMRELYARGGISMLEVSSRFGVGHNTGESAIRGKTWKSVPAVIVKQCPTCHGRGKVPRDG